MKTIRNLVHTYVMEVVDNDIGFDVELEEELGVEKEYDGNVVHLVQQQDRRVSMRHERHKMKESA